MAEFWRSFGRYQVLSLLDGTFETASDVLLHGHGEAPRQKAIDDVGPTIKIDVNCFALRSADRLMLVDAGTGPFWGAHLGQARGAMRAAGIVPGAVDRVLLTHIHGDHALGLFDETGAYFPRAEIVVPEADLAHFTDPDAEAATPEARRSGFMVAKTLLAAYEGRIRPVPPGPVLPEVEAKALPGHTPGHAGYLIGSGQDRLLLWGDALHLSKAQARDPDLGLVFDNDPPRASETRRAVLGEASAGGWTVAGGHMRGFGRVSAGEAGYGIEQV